MDEELKSSLNEEIRIMDERARDAVYFSSDTFQLPISNLQTRPMQKLDQTATLGECLKVMQKARTGAVLATSGGKLTGIITERDLVLRVIGQVENWESRQIVEFMTPDPEALYIDDPMVFIMNRMYVGNFRHVPIVNEDGEPTHIASIRDVLRFILDHFERHLSNIPPDPYRGPPKRWGG